MCLCMYEGLHITFILQDTMDTSQNLFKVRITWESMQKQQHENVKTSLQQLGKQVRDTLLHELPDMHTVCQPTRCTDTI
jgi:hypothetical protein